LGQLIFLGRKLLICQGLLRLPEHSIISPVDKKLIPVKGFSVTVCSKLHRFHQNMLQPIEPKEAGELLSSIKVESVMARLPLHVLSKGGDGIKIHIEKRTEKGDYSLLWEVSPSSKFGIPRLLAYKIDTLVINRRIDEAGHPVPTVLKLGSLRALCRELEMDIGGSGATSVRSALAQNAGTTIRAKLTYRDKEGHQRRFEGYFHRYSVIFTGESLPDGSEADGIYIVFNEVYRNFLNLVPVRPLDFNYLKELAPSVQRFYEIVSFPIYAALTSGHPRAYLTYSEYCEASPQPRYFDRTRMSKQMHKIHKPHLRSGYIAEVNFEEIQGENGALDWRMCYTPGPKARAEYHHFNSNAEVDENAFITPQQQFLPLPPTEADQLTAHFITCRFGRLKRNPTTAERETAVALLEDFGLNTAKELVSLAIENASKAGEPPKLLNAFTETIRLLAHTNPIKASKTSTKGSAN